MASIEARGLRKSYGATKALDGVDLKVEEGRILGLIGPNGAGKTTALNAVLGLTPCEGELKVLGLDPWTQRNELMRDVCFIADVAVLPRWMKVWQALDYVAGVHPKFDRAKAEGHLARTTIPLKKKVSQLSKGMVTQLHLALVMAIDAKLLVLDEPTLGLDILFRKQFYDSLLNDYYDGKRTIVVTTHQVEEIQHVLTDLAFIKSGRIVLDCSMEGFETRFAEVMVRPEQAAEAAALGPIHERQVFGRSIFLFEGKDRAQLEALGELRTPSIADVFVAVMTDGAHAGEGRGMKGAFYWSVRRELWEHKSVWLTPLAVAAFVLIASVIAASGHVQKAGNLSTLSPDKLQPIVMTPLSLAASVIIVLSLIVAAFYCLDALNGERRDRSILFWKSMPVSDATTVLSKVFVPLAVTPAVAFVIALATQLIMLVPMAAFFKGVGADLGPVVQALPLATMTLTMFYGLVVHSLWFAPIYSLLLLASVAVRRPLLWVLVPTIVVQVLEKIAFGTQYVGQFIQYRIMGAMREAFAPSAMKDAVTSLSQLDPLKFLASPGLWLGLLAAAGFLYLAIRLRRNREPL